MDNLNFVALDFETMTAANTSACSIGMVKIIDGVIVQEFYSLINPIQDDYSHFNTHVHGIDFSMVVNAPSFHDLFPFIVQFMDGCTLISHNRNTDINVLIDCMDYYSLSGIDVNYNICTYELTGLSLKDACSKFGINQGAHHNALDDAIACAKVFLALKGKIIADTSGTSIKDVKRNFVAREFDRQTLVALDETEIENKETIFYLQKVVVTGIFENIDRNKLYYLLQSLGADINTSISKQTKIVIIGSGAGPSKIKKIEELKSKGADIRVVYEQELYNILNL